MLTVMVGGLTTSRLPEVNNRVAEPYTKPLVEIAELGELHHR
jgi:hypothetical protein